MKRTWIIGAGCLIFFTGCAHLRPSSSLPTQGEEAEVPAPKALGDVLSQDINQGPAREMTITNGDISIRGIKLQDSKFDFPITVNSRVEFWIDYFTGRGRDYFTKYLERSEFFIPYIKPILKQKGMPEDLVYLAMIESGFNNFARSHAKAVGPWQFIAATGKRYGLMVNWWVDERRDIRKSTVAAIEYLNDLYKMFGTWELAAASYNAGEAKIARATQRFGTTDFWTIARQRFLRPETRDYVPKIIAAAIITKNRVQFGFPASGIRPASDEAVAGDGELVKVIKTDKPEEKIDHDEAEPVTLTEALQAADEESAAAPTTAPIATAPHTPEITAAALTTQAEPNETLPLAKPVPTPHVTKDGQVGGEQMAEFEVQSPADLLKIARAAGLSYQTVKSLNPELLRWCTPPNVGSYRLKLPASVKEKFLTTYNHAAYPRAVQFASYKVHRGETLSKIARHYGIKVDPITDLNGVSPRMPLQSGVKVLLPLPNDRSRSLASLDVRDPPEPAKHHRRHHGHYYKITYKKRESARTHFHRTNTDG